MERAEYAVVVGFPDSRSAQDRRIPGQPLKQNMQIKRPETKSARKAVYDAGYSSISDRRLVPLVDAAVLVQITIDQISHAGITEIVFQTTTGQLFLRVKHSVPVTVVHQVAKLLPNRIPLLPSGVGIIVGAYRFTPVHQRIFGIGEHASGMDAE